MLKKYRRILFAVAAAAQKKKDKFTATVTLMLVRAHRQGRRKKKQEKKEVNKPSKAKMHLVFGKHIFILSIVSPSRQCASVV